MSNWLDQVAPKMLVAMPSLRQLLEHTYRWERSKVVGETAPFLSGFDAERMQYVAKEELEKLGRGDCVPYLEAIAQSIVWFNLYGEHGPYAPGSSNYNARENAISHAMRLVKLLAQRHDGAVQAEAAVAAPPLKPVSSVTATQGHDAPSPEAEREMADQEIFLSWSKPASKAATETFKELLPQLLHGVNPWMSTKDIAKGTGWFDAICDQLSRSRSCVIFVTVENIDSSWLYYEAGAVAHAMTGARVFPYLIGVKPSNLSGTPLGQYQVTTFDRDDTRKLIFDLNQTLETPLPDAVLSSAFDGVWPKLQRRLNKNSPKSERPSRPDSVSTPLPLCDDAQRILIQAAGGDRKTVTVSKTGQGFNLGAGGKDIVSDSMDERQEITLRAAVEQLLERGFIEDRFGRGEVFPVTKAGLDAVEQLTKANETSKPSVRI